MGFGEIVLFIRSLPEILKVLGNINDSLQQIKRDSINKELDKIKEEIDRQIQLLTTAKNDEDRKKALLSLVRATTR